MNSFTTSGVKCYGAENNWDVTQASLPVGPRGNIGPPFSASGGPASGVYSSCWALRDPRPLSRRRAGGSNKTKSFEPQQNTSRFLSLSSTSSTWPGRGRALATDRHTHTSRKRRQQICTFQKQSIFRSRNRKTPAKNAVAFISRTVMRPRSAPLSLLARWASPGLCSLRSAHSRCTCS